MVRKGFQECQRSASLQPNHSAVENIISWKTFITLFQFDRTNQSMKIQTYKIPNIGISLHVNHYTTYHPIHHNVDGSIHGIFR